MKVITIGRSQENDIIINDAKVSRVHLQLVIRDDGSYSVVDLNSANGTYINGKRISGEAKLKQCDEIRIGDTIIPWLEYIRTDSTKSIPTKKKNKKNIYAFIIAASILIFVGIGWAIYHNYKIQKLKTARQLELAEAEAKAEEEENKKKKEEQQQLKEKTYLQEIDSLRLDRDFNLELAKSRKKEAQTANEARIEAEKAKEKAEQAKLIAENEAKKAKEDAHNAKIDAEMKIQAIENQKKEEIISANNERDEANIKAALTEQFYNLYIKLTKKEPELICKHLNLTKGKNEDYKLLLKTAFDKANNNDKQEIVNAIKDFQQQDSISTDSTSQVQIIPTIDSIDNDINNLK